MRIAAEEHRKRRKLDLAVCQPIGSTDHRHLGGVGDSFATVDHCDELEKMNQDASWPVLAPT